MRRQINKSNQVFKISKKEERASQRTPDFDSEEAGLDVDLLIDLIQELELLWNMGDRRHSHVVVTRRLWEEVCHEVVDHWEDLEVRARNPAWERVINRWRSLRDRFQKEFSKKMQAPSGSGRRRSKYKYARAVSFVRSTMVSRNTVCSTREPAELNRSEEIPQESATGGHFDRPDPPVPSQPSLTSDPSVPSTSAGASWQTPLHEAAGEDVAFPLPHPCDTAATSRTPLGFGWQRQRGQEKSYAPEFLHLNTAFQNSLKLLSEQMTAGFNLLNNSILELHTRLDRMHSDASKSKKHSFFQTVHEGIGKLSLHQQMHVMQACQFALANVTSKAPPPAPVVPPAPAPLQPLSLLPLLYNTIFLPCTSSLPLTSSQPHHLCLHSLPNLYFLPTTTSLLPPPSCPKHNLLLHPPPPNPSTPPLKPSKFPSLLQVLCPPILFLHPFTFCFTI
ncbi:uncharacterized protein LOC143767037 [Ranitomeya variabilis]|uniref:uncharacterized protein LOC143767037 n=1 Tax=Ranitomeya variabilis TaxID=490064 RepID=UPI004055CDB8